MTTFSGVLEDLFDLIESRRGAEASASYTASLLTAGKAACAQKLGEEAIETVIAATGQDRSRVIAESADLLYHLLVLWAAAGISPQDVGAELDRRRGQSGHQEKASRKSE